MYGLRHSNPVDFGAGETVDENRHLSLLEKSRLINGFIPEGLILDLTDDNGNYSANYENSAVTDNVKGYTISFIFNTLTTDKLDPTDIIPECTSSLPTGVANNDVIDLFSSY